MLGQSPLLDEMMEKLQSRINRELKFHQDLMKLRGALDMTLAQVCLFVHLFFLHIFSIYPLSPVSTESVFASPTLGDIQWIELMIGCFESG